MGCNGILPSNPARAIQGKYTVNRYGLCSKPIRHAAVIGGGYANALDRQSGGLCRSQARNELPLVNAIDHSIVAKEPRAPDHSACMRPARLARPSDATPPEWVANGDRRFAHPGWNSPPFEFLKLFHLATEYWWRLATHDIRGMRRPNSDRVAFLARQALDAASPSNNPFFNPEIIERTLASGGTNLGSILRLTECRRVHRMESGQTTRRVTQ